MEKVKAKSQEIYVKTKKNICFFSVDVGIIGNE